MTIVRWVNDSSAVINFCSSFIILALLSCRRKNTVVSAASASRKSDNCLRGATVSASYCDLCAMIYNDLKEFPVD